MLVVALLWRGCRVAAIAAHAKSGGGAGRGLSVSAGGAKIDSRSRQAKKLALTAPVNFCTRAGGRFETLACADEQRRVKIADDQRFIRRAGQLQHPLLAHTNTGDKALKDAFWHGIMAKALHVGNRDFVH